MVRLRIVITETDEPSPKWRRNFAMSCSRGRLSTPATDKRGTCHSNRGGLL
jgi:hypothetical protein